MSTAILLRIPLNGEFEPLLAGAGSLGFRRNLAVARMREERSHAELIEAARTSLASAWVHSTHHSWLEDVWDFLLEESNYYDSYDHAGRRLLRELQQLHREGHELYSHEEDAVKELAAKLAQYARALKEVADLEQDRYLRIFSESQPSTSP